jgi:hypothetical protein
MQTVVVHDTRKTCNTKMTTVHLQNRSRLQREIATGGKNGCTHGTHGRMGAFDCRWAVPRCLACVNESDSAIYKVMSRKVNIKDNENSHLVMGVLRLQTLLLITLCSIACTSSIWNITPPCKHVLVLIFFTHEELVEDLA